MDEDQPENSENVEYDDDDEEEPITAKKVSQTFIDTREEFAL